MKKLFKGFIIVLIMTILSKVASFISEIIIASLLGTSSEADAYSMIVGIHQVIYPMLSVGIWSIFLPIYKKKITKKDDNADTYINNTLSFFIGISAILVIVILLFSNYIVMIIANGFSDEMQHLCSNLLRVYSPYFIFVVVSSVFAAILQCEDKFFASQLREVATYIPTIIIGPIMYKYYGLYGLVVALVFGSILRLAVLIPFLRKDYKFKFIFSFNNKDIKHLLKGLPNVLITSGIEQVNVLIDKIMASNLVVGSVSSLNYGNKLINVLNGLFTSAISTSLYPTMSKLVAQDRLDELKKVINKIFKIVYLVIIPISIIMIILSKQIVYIVYSRGAFDNSSVLSTSSVFLGYSIGMLFIGLKPIINNIFYSFEDTRKIMHISIITITINIVLNIIFVKYWDVAGLAIATSISAIIYFIASLNAAKKYNCIDIKTLTFDLIKVLFLCIIPTIIVLLVNVKLEKFNFYIQAIIISLLYFIIYFIEIIIFERKELQYLMNLLFRKGEKDGK